VIVYRSESEGGGLYGIPDGGGVPNLLAPRGRRPRFSPTGTWILYWQSDERYAPGRIYVVPAGGGESRRFAVDFADAHNPVWSPDGNAVLFCGTRVSGDPAQEHDWWVIPFPNGPPVKTGAFERLSSLKGRFGAMLRARGDQMGTPVQWTPEGLYFLAGYDDRQSLWRIRIGRGFRVDGDPERLSLGTGFETGAAVHGKHILFATGSQRVSLYSVPLEPSTGIAVGEPKRLTVQPEPEFQPALSPDGRNIAYVVDRQGGRFVKILNLENGSEFRISPEDVRSDSPVFSPDGKEIAYLRENQKLMAICKRKVDGGAEEILSADAGTPTSWSRDGRWLLYEPGALIPFVGALDTKTQRKIPLLKASEWGLRSPVFSPDGKWVSFQADIGSSSRQVMVAPFRPDAQVPRESWIELSPEAESDYLPAWSEDGRLLYFISERDGTRSVWARRFDPARGAFDGPPFIALPMRHADMTFLRNYRTSLRRIGLKISKGKMAVSLDVTRSNLWIAEYR
jgi:Tol biopolymer transport system component